MPSVNSVKGTRQHEAAPIAPRMPPIEISVWPVWLSTGLRRLAHTAVPVRSLTAMGAAPSLTFVRMGPVVPTGSRGKIAMDKSALHDTAPRLPIGALSKRTGCNIETIRYYEKIGLLAAPIRSEGGHRMYGTGHFLRLTFTRRARDLGFTLDEVRALLRLADERDRPCGEARDVAASHLVDVRAKIADLKKMARVLTEM